MAWSEWQKFGGISKGTELTFNFKSEASVNVYTSKGGGVSATNTIPTMGAKQIRINSGNVVGNISGKLSNGDDISNDSTLIISCNADIPGRGGGGYEVTSGTCTASITLIF